LAASSTNPTGSSPTTTPTTTPLSRPPGRLGTGNTTRSAHTDVTTTTDSLPPPDTSCEGVAAPPALADVALTLSPLLVPSFFPTSSSSPPIATPHPVASSTAGTLQSMVEHTLSPTSISSSSYHPPTECSPLTPVHSSTLTSVDRSLQFPDDDDVSVLTPSHTVASFEGVPPATPTQTPVPTPHDETFEGVAPATSSPCPHSKEWQLKCHRHMSLWSLSTDASSAVGSDILSLPPASTLGHASQRLITRSPITHISTHAFIDTHDMNPRSGTTMSTSSPSLCQPAEHARRLVLHPPAQPPWFKSLPDNDPSSLLDHLHPKYSLHPFSNAIQV
jgi:hypothetical protein